MLAVGVVKRSMLAAFGTLLFGALLWWGMANSDWLRDKAGDDFDTAAAVTPSRREPDQPMSAAVDEIEFIDCACYTHGRRHPEVLGSLGLTQLPFQVTGQSLVAFAVTGAVMVLSWVKGGWWTWLLPTPLNAMLCVVVPVTVGVVAQYVRIDGRNPLVGWAGLRPLRISQPSRRGRRSADAAAPCPSTVGSWVRVREGAVKAPIRAVVGNLVWNRSGQVWAVYAVDPVGSMHASHSSRSRSSTGCVRRS